MTDSKAMAKTIRKDIKKSFPNEKISVRVDTYGGVVIFLGERFDDLYFAINNFKKQYEWDRETNPNGYSVGISISC